jgi:hypothetical protein
MLRVMREYFGEVGLLKVFPLLLKTIKGEKVFHHTGVRIASWPDKHNIDMDEILYAKYQHLYMGKENMDFFESLILNKGL